MEQAPTWLAVAEAPDALAPPIAGVEAQLGFLLSALVRGPLHTAARWRAPPARRWPPGGCGGSRTCGTACATLGPSCLSHGRSWHDHCCSCLVASCCHPSGCCCTRRFASSVLALLAQEQQLACTLISHSGGAGFDQPYLPSSSLHVPCAVHTGAHDEACCFPEAAVT